VTPSTVVCPFAERLERPRVLPRARALGFLCAELLLRPADAPLDERPPERPFDACDRDLEEPDDAPRRWDVLVWAMFSPLLLGIRSPISYPRGIGLIVRPVA
jgi:hypothetical protein